MTLQTIAWLILAGGVLALALAVWVTLHTPRGVPSEHANRPSEQPGWVNQPDATHRNGPGNLW